MNNSQKSQKRKKAQNKAAPKQPSELEYFNRELANAPPSGKDSLGIMNFV